MLALLSRFFLLSPPSHARVWNGNGDGEWQTGSLQLNAGTRRIRVRVKHKYKTTYYTPPQRQVLLRPTVEFISTD
uniref:Putative secreted protein n=1 Tax=Anopheles triannulatus TaxID=58253 RepID=A0A2M4B7N2_9DIPT